MASRPAGRRPLERGSRILGGLSWCELARACILRALQLLLLHASRRSHLIATLSVHLAASRPVGPSAPPSSCGRKEQPRSGERAGNKWPPVRLSGESAARRLSGGQNAAAVASAGRAGATARAPAIESSEKSWHSGRRGGGRSAGRAPQLGSARLSELARPLYLAAGARRPIRRAPIVHCSPVLGAALAALAALTAARGPLEPQVAPTAPNPDCPRPVRLSAVHQGARRPAG